MNLGKTEFGSPSMDRVHYPLLKHVPDHCLLILLQLYSVIWNTERLLHSMKQPVNKPIRKHGKGPSSFTPYFCNGQNGKQSVTLASRER